MAYEYTEVGPGSAADFVTNLNANFGNISPAIVEVETKSDNKIIDSSTQPTSQNPGDIWLDPTGLS